MKNSIKGLALVLALLLIWIGSVSAEVIRGKVTTIDLKANRISLESEGKSRSFTFDAEDFIVWKGDDEVKTDEIKAGTEAEVGYYTDETGIEMASWVDLTPIEEGEEISVPTEVISSPEALAPALPAPGAPAALPAATQEHPGKEHPGTAE